MAFAHLNSVIHLLTLTLLPVRLTSQSYRMNMLPYQSALCNLLFAKIANMRSLDPKISLLAVEYPF